MANNSSSKYTFTSPSATYENGNTQYTYTISTTYSPQFIPFQSSAPTNSTNRPKSSTPTPNSTSKPLTLKSPSRPKPLPKHAKSASGRLPTRKTKQYSSSFNNNNIPENTTNYKKPKHKPQTSNDLQPVPSPHQRSVSSNLSMEYNPSSGSYGYSVTTHYSSIPTYVSEHSASTALGISQAPSHTYVFIAPQPMKHTPSVAYLNTSTTNTTNYNNNKSKPKIISKNVKKKKYKPKSMKTRSLPPAPTHPKKSRSFTNRNDIISENKQYNHNTNTKTSKLVIPKRISNSSNSGMDDDDDNNINKPPNTITRSKTLNDSNMHNKNNSNHNIGYRNKSADSSSIKSKSQNNSRTGSRTGSTHSTNSSGSNDNINNEMENSFETLEEPMGPIGLGNRSKTTHDNYKSNNSSDLFGMSVKHSRPRSNNFRQHSQPHPRHSNTFCVSKAPLIKQSKSLTDENENESDKIEEKKEEFAEEKKQENEDWQIMGDILFSLRHSLYCRINGIEDNNNNKKNNKKKKKKSKKHLSVKSNEWQTYYFEEYAQLLFTELRSKWLSCDNKSDKYIKKLFGETDETIAVENLDINKACRYYWRRLNTNSKSGQIFFQTINGEYIIKSMPKSEAEFFRKSFLEKYHSYMLSESDSLLMHIMGCYNIKYKKSEMQNNTINLASNNEYNSKRKQDVNKGVYVIVMKSILFCEMTPTVKMHKIYDLKGSKHNRTASRYKLELNKLTLDALTEIDEQSFEQEINSISTINDNIKLISSSYSCGFYKPLKNEKIEKFKSDHKNKEKGAINVYKRSKVLKDLDFMQDNEIINIGQKIKGKYLIQLRKDLNFLISMNVMDYSLLVGIHKLQIGDKNNKNKTIRHKRQHSHTKPKRIKEGNLFTFEFGGMCAEKIMFDTKKYNKHNKKCMNALMKKNIYFTGIIDFLQKYNTKKKMESYYKRVKVSEGKDAISSVDSKTYANRLYDFIEKRII